MYNSICHKFILVNKYFLKDFSEGQPEGFEVRVQLAFFAFSAIIVWRAANTPFSRKG